VVGEIDKENHGEAWITITTVFQLKFYIFCGIHDDGLRRRSACLDLSVFLSDYLVMNIKF
jgi:hypothetical protein